MGKLKVKSFGVNSFAQENSSKNNEKGMKPSIEDRKKKNSIATKTNKIIDGSSGDEIFYYFAENNTDRNAIDKVMEKYPVRITSFLKTLIERSDALRREYLPSPKELETSGTPTPFEEGKEASETYGLERVYRDRVLMTPHFDCPAYCRFCYKKSRVMRNQYSMTFEDIDKASLEIGKMKDVRGVLLTGGEPFMNQEKLFYTLDKVIELENIFEIRVGTRTIINSPEIFNEDLCNRLASYLRPNLKNPEKSKYLALNVHFNHPDELVAEVITACNRLTSKGVTLRNQCVLLKGINDNIEIIKQLFALLVRNNMIPYYFNHCMPVEGSDHLRCTVQKGLYIYKYLCTESSTIIPNYVYANYAGKVHLGPDSPLHYVKHNNRRYITVKMPYLAEEFKRITHKDLPPMHVKTEDGFIRGMYLDGVD
jgi:lysine 2,3-aminomutase